MISITAIASFAFVIAGMVSGVSAHFINDQKKGRIRLITMAVLMVIGNILLGIDLFAK